MTATMIGPERPKRMPVPMNGVDTPSLLATVNAVGAEPDLAEFQFRAKSRWIAGTHTQTTMNGYFGAGAEQTRDRTHRADGDHPAILCGSDNGPTPVEWVLHALATCLTAGIANIAAARGVRLHKVESTVEGDIDLRGILGLTDEVRNGFRAIRISFDIDGVASPAELENIIMKSKARSAVYDIVTNGVPVAIDVKSPASV
jgi:uncharacterized OsmC-like protein